jgi:hypothetical protein
MKGMTVALGCWPSGLSAAGNPGGRRHLARAWMLDTLGRGGKRRRTGHETCKRRWETASSQRAKCGLFDASRKGGISGMQERRRSPAQHEVGRTIA